MILDHDRVLFTDTPSFHAQDQQMTILEAIHTLLPETKELEIAVGYASKASLRELDRLVHEHGISYTTLIIGMYYSEGMPEQMYRTALEINEKWQNEGIGEILIVLTPKYHGKLYRFKLNAGSSVMIIGSANLSVLKPDASTRMQYELGYYVQGPDPYTYAFFRELKKKCVNIQNASDMPVISTLSCMLDGDPNCEHMSKKQLEVYLTKLVPGTRFDVEIKCPTEAELQMDRPPLMGSNINVCYSKPRKGEDMRDFYEVQVNLPTELLRQGVFPKWHPFFVITDDGYWFKVKNTSGEDIGKQLTAGGAGDRVFGKWLKGRLIAAGLLEEPEGKTESRRFEHAVTKDMLAKYGRDTLTFIKTSETAVNDEKMSEEEWTEYKQKQAQRLSAYKAELEKKGTFTLEEYEKKVKTETSEDWFYSQDELDVWYLSFAPGGGL